MSSQVQVCVFVCTCCFWTSSVSVGDLNEDIVPLVIRCNSGLIVDQNKNLRKVYICSLYSVPACQEEAKVDFTAKWWMTKKEQ